jgi:putative addiction module killer protein
LTRGELRARINVRIRRLSPGNPGDVKPVGSGMSEMRVDYGPGYRVYYQQRGEVLVLLLCGGDKRSQDTDIKRAIKIAKDWKGGQRCQRNPTHWRRNVERLPVGQRASVTVIRIRRRTWPGSIDR